MAFTPASNLEAVEALYIGYFGRAGEPGGVDYWVGRMNQGMTFAEVAASFSVQPEALEQHPYLANPTSSGAAAFVQSLYTQLLNRPDAQTADATGFNYWVNQLQNADGPLDVGLLIAQFISGAQGADIVTLQNKIDAAEYFTNELDAANITGTDSSGRVTDEVDDIATEVINGVTNDPATVTASKAETDAYVEDGTIPSGGGGGNPGGNPGGGGGGGGSSGPALNGTVLILSRDDAYNIAGNSNGGWDVSVNGDVQLVVSSAQVTALTEINVNNPNGSVSVAGSLLAARSVALSGTGDFDLTGVGFTQANAALNNRFEPSVNLDGVITATLAQYNGDLGEVFDHLQVNGGPVGTFQLLWDYIDDNYSYYNNAINESGIRLGLEYVSYLEAGGQPLTDIIVKFASDGGDVGSDPDRVQSLHDNLLGNLHGPSILDKLAGSGQGGSNPNPTPGQYDAMVALIDGEAAGIRDRGIVTGNEYDIGNGPYNSALAFDYEQGWARPDYVSFTTDGEGDIRSIDQALAGGRYLYVGNGVPADQMATVENVGAGVELSFGIRHFGVAPAYNASSVAETTVGASFVFNVEDGIAPGRSGQTDRAEWSFNPVVVAGTNGQDETLSAFRFELDIDLDPTAGERTLTLELNPNGGTRGQGEWRVAAGSEVGTVGTPVIPDNEGNGFTSQNSHNFAFYQTLFDVDPATAGNQPYNYGAGQFEFELRAYDGANLIGVNHTTVFVA